MTIETLTDEERDLLLEGDIASRVEEKALRIIDQLTARVAEIEDPLREKTWAGRFQALTERAEKAEAECERLRLEVVSRREASAYLALRDRIAAANELLGQCRAYPVPIPLIVRIDAHLAGQVAPTRTEAEPEREWKPEEFCCNYHATGASVDRPCKPNRTEAEPVAEELWCDSCEESMTSEEGDGNRLGVCAKCWAKHEAEQRVLDAMARLDEMQLQMIAEEDDDGMWTMAAVAELARRGLKP